jgi:hypothetical protein
MRGLVLSVLVILGTAATVHAQEGKEQGRQYTAFNIWVLSKQQRHNQRFINYKVRGSRILPAGTPVFNIEALSSPAGGGFISSDDSNFPGPHVAFETSDGTRYEILFKGKWHPGKTLEDYKNYLITDRSFEQLTEGLSDQEIDAIKNGVVIAGMSKRAVLISYGYPPEHKTPSLDSNSWLYWLGKTTRKEICFDTEGKAARCGQFEDAEVL